MERNGVKNRKVGATKNAQGTKHLLEPSVGKNLFCALRNVFGKEATQNADVGPQLLPFPTERLMATDTGVPKQLKKNVEQKQQQTRSKQQTLLPQTWTSLVDIENTSKKSMSWAYVWWLFGGFFGVHLFYLHRDMQAFLTWSTLGGYGIGWLADITKIPRYVRDCNNEPRFLADLVEKIRRNRKPPFSTSRFISAVMVGYLWGQIILIAIPEDEMYGINWNTYLHWFIPLGVALGVWTVGNIGREQGKPWITIAASYITYSSRWYFFDESIWMSIVMLSAAFAFDTFSKEWRIKPKKKKPLWKRVMIMTFCGVIYIGLLSSYFYFNGKVQDSNGDNIPVREAIHHFFTSSWWTDFKSSLYEIYQFAQHHGWYEIWKQIIDLSDPQGEQNAYKVLGVSPTASQQEITSRWRTLSRENHPDKCKDPDKLREAQETFMEIQQAYEILSNIKNNRRRKNKKSVDEDL